MWKPARSNKSVKSPRTSEYDLPPAASSGDRPSITLNPGERALIPLGFKAQIPEGYHGEVRPRSGAAFRKGIEIPNSPGTIGSDYGGEWMVPVDGSLSG